MSTDERMEIFIRLGEMLTKLNPQQIALFEDLTLKMYIQQYPHVPEAVQARMCETAFTTE
jgi:hypothetical protein